MNYYNEIDPYAAQWLRNLIAVGHLPAGHVDERSIADVKPRDVMGYTQCHFFAGIGGWSLALRLSGWPEDKPVWTGSPPCQPFSAAGKKRGMQDERHLWPEFYRLIAAVRPEYVFGEQVAKAIGFDWLDHVADDLEKAVYEVGAVVLPACSVGAFHIRERLWFVGESKSQRWLGGEPRVLEPQKIGGVPKVSREGARDAFARRYGSDGYWGNAEWIPCRDGKRRAVEPGTFPLAHGVSARVGRLRAYGNAIVPQVAAEVIKAFL